MRGRTPMRPPLCSLREAARSPSCSLCSAAPSGGRLGSHSGRKIQILVDVVLLVIDIVLDIKVGVYYCSQGLWLFGPLALVIPGLAGLICFVYKRWSWRLGKDADCMLRSVDDRGRAKLIFPPLRARSVRWRSLSSPSDSCGDIYDFPCRHKIYNNARLRGK